jgi:phospholipid/cholesterol/gamma-HCH transport system substrate-binding protein
VQVKDEIQRKLTGQMAWASRAFLWFAAAGIIGVLAVLGYSQRWFTPTLELYFYAPTAAGLNRGMAVKLVGFRIGTLEEVSLVGELRVKGRVVIDRHYRDSIGKDSRLRLAREGVIGAYVLELITGQGDAGPVEKGSVLVYERELDYSTAVAGLLERAGPLLDDARAITSRMSDPEGKLQMAIHHLNEAAKELASMAVGLRQLAADGSNLARSVPGRVDPVLEDMRRGVARAESLLGDAQGSLARADSVLKRTDDALPAMLEDTRRSLQNVRAATESLNRAMAQDVPRILTRGEATLDDADELIGGVRRAWPVSGMLPRPAQKVIELDSGDGAEHAAARPAGR